MKRIVMTLIAGAAFAVISAGAPSAQGNRAPDVISAPYDLSGGLESRTISFENPTGEKGAAGKAASALGVGRKGAPARTLKPGETAEMCDLAGPGTIRHIWITIPGRPENLRGCVIRGDWEGAGNPGIECPSGDFMGFPHGFPTPRMVNGTPNSLLKLFFDLRAAYSRDEGQYALTIIYTYYHDDYRIYLNRSGLLL